MIVEFVGCTGAGKTTLARGAVHRLRAQHYLVQDHSVVGSSALLTLGNALSAPFHFLALLRDWSRYADHLRFTCRALAGAAPSPFWAVTRANAALRLVARHARHARAGRREIGIVDDGALATAQLAFYGDRAPPPRLLERFVALAPLADIIVWVDAPLHALVDRTLTRPDPPRELRGRPHDEVQARLAHVRTAFDAVAGAPRSAGRVIRVWNPTAPPHDRDQLVGRVANEICRRLDTWPA